MSQQVTRPTLPQMVAAKALYRRSPDLIEHFAIASGKLPKDPVAGWARGEFLAMSTHLAMQLGLNRANRATAEQTLEWCNRVRLLIGEVDEQP